MLDVFCLHGSYGADATPYGCTFVRLLLPLSHPAVAGRVRMRHGTEPPTDSPDVVVVERTWKEGTTLADAERLLAELSRRRVPVLHAVDDNLLDLNADEPWQPFPSAEDRAVFRLFSRESRGVLVSTEPLARRLRRLNPRIEVVPNALDERLWDLGPKPFRRAGPLVVGYMGTRTHDADLFSVLRGLREVLHLRPGTRLELVGLSNDPRLLEPFEGLPVSRLEPGPEGAYPLFVRWLRRTVRWDVAIAPLEDDPFTACKSNLKQLDYAALGAAGVFGDSVPYRGPVVDGENGLLVPNEPSAFRDALLRLLDDAGLRERLATRALSDLRARHTLATGAAVHVEAIERLLSGPEAGRVSPDRG